MADRYWVGGTADWDTTAGTKWAETSGGAGGVSVPTSADDVFFSNLSTGTCTIRANPGARGVNCTGFTGTIQINAAFSIGAGGLTLVSGMSFTNVTSSTISFIGGGILISAAKIMGPININGAGSTLTLGSALSLGSVGTLTITNGGFDTGGYAVTAIAFLSTNTNTRTILLRTSTITLSRSSDTLRIFSTNLTFDAGTSQINLSSNTASIECTAVTLWNVTCNSTFAPKRVRILGGNFNNFTITSATNPGVTILELYNNIVVAGTLTVAGATPNGRRLFVCSTTLGTSQTISAATLSAANCDFRDIAIAGGATGSAPLRAGNCGGNSGITFPAPKTVFRVGTSSNWPGTNSWALTSGGAGSSNNYPLPQDTAIINNATSGTSITMGSGITGSLNLGAVDTSTRTSAFTLNHTGSADRYGSFILGSGINLSNGNAPQTFVGPSNIIITTAGKTIPFDLAFYGSSVTFSDAMNCTGSISVYSGTFSANNNVTCRNFASLSLFPRTINMGSGTWTITDAFGDFTAIWDVSATNLTLNKNTANILLSNTSTTGRLFNGGGQAYNKLTIGTGSQSNTSIAGGNSFTELASLKTTPHTIRFKSNQNTIDTWTVAGSAGNLVNIESDINGQRSFALTNTTTNAVDYLNVSWINCTTPNKFFVGPNSTNGINNTNVYFSFAGAVATNNSNMLMMFE
jgi:hypothetical protein